MMHLARDEIGGGRARLRFATSDRVFSRGDAVSGDFLRAMPEANRRALIESGHIEVWPRSGGDNNETFVVAIGGGKYDVIRGVKLNDHPMKKDEAEELATNPAL